MIDELIILVYLIMTLSVGLYKARGTKAMRAYSVADCNYTTPVMVAAFFATLVGGGATLGAAQETFEIGVLYIGICLAIPISNILVVHFVAPKVSQFIGCISVGEIMGSYYGKVGRVVTGLSGFLFCGTILGAQISAIGYLLLYCFEVPLLWGVSVGMGVVVIYSAFGGIRAVTAANVIHFITAIMALSIICSIGLHTVGGFEALFKSLPKDHLSFFSTKTIFQKYISLFLIFLLPFLNPAVFQRFLMVKDVKQVTTSFQIVVYLKILFFITAGLIGLIALILSPGLNSNLALPFLAKTILPVGVQGIAIAGIVAIILSSADSMLNAGSITIVHDVLKPLLPKPISDVTELRLTRFMTSLLGCLGIIASINCKNIIELIRIACVFWYPIILIPFLAVIYNIKIEIKGFIWSALAGGTTFLLWNLFIKPALLPSIDGFLPSLVINGVVFFSFYWLRKNKVYIQGLKDTEKASLWKRLFSKIMYYFPTIPNLVNYSTISVQQCPAQSFLFGVFAVVNYILPYFMWSYNSAHYNANLTLRVIAAMLCFILIIKDYWPDKFEKYFPLYWHLTLLYCLPFLTTLILLDSSASIEGLINMALASLFLAILVDWVSFIIILLLGVSLGTLFCWAAYGLNPIIINPHTLYWAIYMYVFSVAIGLMFSRGKEKQEQEKVETMEAMSGSIAHEMRSPLVALNMAAINLKNFWSRLDYMYLFAKEKGFPIDEITPVQYMTFKEIPILQEEASRNALTTIDMFLNNIKTRGSEKYKLEHCSMKQCIEKALKDYPFKNAQEQSMVLWEESNDFKFQGNQNLMVYVLYNLLKNALHFLKLANKGNIKIWLEQNGNGNELHFKDEGPGISANNLKYIFKRFYSKRSNGTGLGLSFCKSVVECFGGKIYCKSIEGEYTEFILSFPCTKSMLPNLRLFR